MDLQTKLPVSVLPSAIRAALLRCGFAKTMVDVRGSTDASICSGYSQSKISFAARVDADGSAMVHQGCFGGANGYNQPRGEWDPDHDEVRKSVPVGGAIISGYRDFCYVTLTPGDFARLVATTSVDAMIASDAQQDGREADAEILARAALVSSIPVLTEGEQAVVYAFVGLKSCDSRKNICRAHADAVESLVTKGWLKRSKNGATAAQDPARTYYATSRSACESAGMKVRW